MSRLMITSDLHLGHKNVIKWRTQFSSNEEHDEVLFDNLMSSIGKRDSIIFLGDVAMTKPWLARIAAIKNHTYLICGNHDTERGITMRHLVESYDKIYSLYSRRNCWLSHCPIHHESMRGRILNIHGHVHESTINDSSYFNACVENTDYKPISFKEILERAGFTATEELI